MIKKFSRSTKGQVSVEYLTAAAVILLLFVVVLLIIEQTKQQSTISQQNAEELALCTKVSSIITYMSSNPPYSETQFEITKDLNVVNNNILVGDFFCPFLGKASNVQLYAGIIRAFDINGTVVFTNDLNYSPFNPITGPPDTGFEQSEGTILLIDDQNQIWVEEVAFDDALYAVSTDDMFVDPDWVEFRFSNAGLTSANQPTDVRVLIKHFESYHIGLGGSKSMIQCYNGTTWLDIEEYTPSFTELYYQSPNMVSCISDWNLANNARIRMTYEPSGTEQMISLDYGRIDINYTQNGILLDLWELQSDLPPPLDFKTDINSTANTFGVGMGNDGWDWNARLYTTSLPSAVYFNADPNMDDDTNDSVVGNTHRLEIKLGGGVAGADANPDDDAVVGPLAGGGYGVQFDINADVASLIGSGAQVLLSFTYMIDADAGWGNSLDAGEEAWLKVRFGNASTFSYLGSNIDTGDNDADASNEIWWADQPIDTYGFFLQDVSSLVSGSGTYYLEIGGALSDWDSATEGLGIYLDNLNLVVV
ncbi:MAG: hypothetical protein V1776_00115 [Candidatus Diapherotrites archaeon]